MYLFPSSRINTQQTLHVHPPCLSSRLLSLRRPFHTQARVQHNPLSSRTREDLEFERRAGKRTYLSAMSDKGPGGGTAQQWAAMINEVSTRVNELICFAHRYSQGRLSVGERDPNRFAQLLETPKFRSHHIARQLGWIRHVRSTKNKSTPTVYQPSRRDEVRQMRSRKAPTNRA